jgi:ABC-type multidrug transport system ATPase subunit
MPQPEDGSEAVVRLDGVSKRYGDVVAVEGVSFQVRRGEFFGLLGPNGAGKTTLVEIVEGMRAADAGQVSVLGRSPWPRDGALLRRIGVQTQSSAFFTRLTAAEHLRTVAALYGLGRATAGRSLELVGLADKAGARVDDLSGGQRQRLAIATALVHEPELIFLDEPTAALDTEARRALWEVLRSLKQQGRTVFYTTHHMDEAQALCDRVAILARGRLAALDSPGNLIRSLQAPTLLSVPADQVPVEVASVLDGVDRAWADGAEVVLETRAGGRVLAALDQIGHLDAVRTRSATLEDAYLALTGGGA